MAKFIFKLQSILNLRKQKEDSVKNELANAMRRLEAEKQSWPALIYWTKLLAMTKRRPSMN